VNRLRNGATTAALIMVLAACRPAASGSSNEPSSATSPAASAAQASRGPVADLEAWIPDTVAGVTMQKQSMQGNDALLEFDDQAAITLLQDLGVSPSDVSLAIGIGYSAALNFSARMFVFRAAGVDPDRLEAAFKKAIDAARDTPLKWTSTSIGAKQVETAVDGPATNYLYVKDDVLVFLLPSDQDVAAEIISGLP
jgi:hypothetical protein